MSLFKTLEYLLTTHPEWYFKFRLRIELDDEGFCVYKRPHWGPPPFCWILRLIFRTDERLEKIRWKEIKEIVAYIRVWEYDYDSTVCVAFRISDADSYFEIDGESQGFKEWSNTLDEKFSTDFQKWEQTIIEWEEGHWDERSPEPPRLIRLHGQAFGESGDLSQWRISEDGSGTWRRISHGDKSSMEDKPEEKQ